MSANEEDPLSENESENEETELDPEEGVEEGEDVGEDVEEDVDDEDVDEEDVVGEEPDGLEDNDDEEGPDYFPGNAEAMIPDEDMYVSDDDFDDDDEGDELSQEDEIDIRIDDEFKTDYIQRIHPEEINESFQIMNEKCLITRDENQFINDSLHVTYPLLTKYERARILGMRISQLNKGAKPLTEYNQFIIDNNIIAEKELREKRLPFIIMRPIPNGGKEYWRLQDLEILDR